MATDGDEAAGQAQQLPIRSSSDFDIVSKYQSLLTDDHELTMPIAAIEALFAALGASSAKTVFETMNLVQTQSQRLLQGDPAIVTNPVAVRHGIARFEQYLRSLQQNENQNFEAVLQQLIANGRLFAERAKGARDNIALRGRYLIQNKDVILTHGGSRAVRTLLERATESAPDRRPRRFKVIVAVNEARREESEQLVTALRNKGIGVATITEGAVAHVIQKVSKIFVGAEAVGVLGGILSRLGTYQIAVVAKAHNKPLYVAVEEHKIGESMSDQDLFGRDDQFRQNLEFSSCDYTATPKISERGAISPLDYTPHDLITNYICDHGVFTPQQICEQIIDNHFNP
ncbi:nagb/rpia/CoA transferase-like protein [Xylariaceae sp. FL0255]|nr:nagb/rpia/CoA transferase-like protein [Xylariaceae sp. FL0255]